MTKGIHAVTAKFLRTLAGILVFAHGFVSVADAQQGASAPTPTSNWALYTDQVDAGNPCNAAFTEATGYVPDYPSGGQDFHPVYYSSEAAALAAVQAAYPSGSVIFDTSSTNGTFTDYSYYVSTPTCPLNPPSNSIIIHEYTYFSFDISQDTTDGYELMGASDYGRMLGPEIIPCNCGADPSGHGSTGDPIDIASGNVSYQVTDYTTAGDNPLAFTRYYNSLETSFVHSSAASLGVGWRNNFDRYIQIISSSRVIAERADGKQLTFNLSGTLWTSAADVDVKLAKSGTTWTLTDTDDTVETYTSNASGTLGVLNAIARRNGYMQTMAYTKGQLTRVTDSYGRSLTFTYSGSQFHTLVTPEGNTYVYSFNSQSQLAYVASPIDSAGGYTYQYLYQSFGNYRMLTGIQDRYGTYIANWIYDSDNARGIESYQGDSSTQANLTTISYDDANKKRTITNALGVTDTYLFAISQGVPKIASISRASTSTTPAMSRSFTYDSNGYMASETDWNGNKTTYVRNSRGDPTTIHEAVGSSVARTTTIAYDPTWVHLPKTIITAGLTTGFTYDSHGNILTKELTDTTSQTVPYSTEGQTRTWTFTYDATGHRLTVKNPRLYSTALTWTEGTLTKISNPLLQSVHITAYTDGGYPKTIVDANGVSTTLTYDTQMRVTNSALTTTAGVLNTQYFYWFGDFLYTIILPDTGEWLRQPDTALRMQSFRDPYGSRIALTLNGLGESTATNVFDSTSTLQKVHSASFDGLNRRLTDQGANSQITTFSYDHNGNTLTAEDALSHRTTKTYDALNRLATSTDANEAEAVYTYDAYDRPLTAKDKDGNTTTNIYNGFGDLIEQISPDSGKTIFYYDADGNPIKKVDNSGNVTEYTYDALDRMLTTEYASDATENTRFSYDQTGHGFGIGRLTSVTDVAGTLSRTYDERGNMLTETRVNGGKTYKTIYTYDSVSRVASITYPSGAKVTLARDLTGHVNQMPFSASGTDLTTVAFNIAHLPFGPVTSLGYGQGDHVAIGHDQDYRTTSMYYYDEHNVSYWAWTYGYDVADNLHTITDQVYPAKLQTLGYDALNRLDSAVSNGLYGTQAWHYDKNGNLLTTTTGGVTYTQTYTAGTNKVAATTWPSNSESYVYDGRGNIEALTKNGTKLFSLTFNQANRMTAASGSGVAPTITNMTYDAFGKRITKTSSTTSIYTYDLDGNVIEENNAGTVTDYFYLDGNLIGDWSPSEHHFYPIFFDNRGVPLVARDEYGLTTWQADYSSPYGTMNITQKAGSYSGPMTENIRLPGQFFDKESGIYRNGQRDYLPGLGRYLEVDPIGLGGGLNPYAYVGGMPTRFVDAWGLEPVDWGAQQVNDMVQERLLEQFFKDHGASATVGKYGAKACLAMREHTLEAMAVGEEVSPTSLLLAAAGGLAKSLAVDSVENDPAVQQAEATATDAATAQGNSWGSQVNQWINNALTPAANLANAIANALNNAR